MLREPPSAAAGQESVWHRTGRLRLVAAGRTALTPHRIAILIVLLLALGFYMWTANQGLPFVFSASNNDPYNLLTTGFLHGHTYLPIQPPAGLLHLSDPYDPTQNAPYQLAYHDLSLYKGHFYSSWGPTPALTLFLPFRLTGLKMSESFAVALFSFVGLVCAVALLHVLSRRFLPSTPNWFLTLASVGIALTNVAPFLLRRPEQYEVAISGGYCFEMLGILLVVGAVLASPVRRWRLAFGSLCLGLAVGSRPDLAAGAFVAVAGAIYLIRRRGEGHRVLVPALAPLVACGALLALYNDARFGSFTQFGTSYVLAGLNAHTMPTQRLAYIPPGLFSYLFIPPRIALTFPHVFLMSAAQYPFPFPHGYLGSPGAMGAEIAGGMLPTMPITLVLLALPLLWARRPTKAERPALLLATGLSVLGLMIMVLLAYALFGTTQRYEVDYATLFLIASSMVCAVLVARSSGRKVAKRLIVLTATILTVLGAAMGTAVSFTGYYQTLQYPDSSVTNTLEDVTSPFATLATMVGGGKPEIARIYGPVPPVLPPVGYGTVDENGAGTFIGGGPVTVVVDAPSAQTAALTAIDQVGPGSPRRLAWVMHVQSPGRSAWIRIVGASVRMPIRLHWGLNRIKLTLLDPSPEALFLGDLALGH